MELYKKDINGKNIIIADYPGEKGTIIAIHGLTGTHKNMHYYAEKFKGEYRFISVDLRGRGNSGQMDPSPSIFNHADDIIGLIKELNIKNPILMGHSMGAFISSIVASKLEDTKAVILLDGAASMSEHQQKIVLPSLGRISEKYKSKEHYVEAIKSIYNNLGISWNEVMQDVVEYEVAQVEDHWENKSTESLIKADFESFYKFNPKETFSQVKCPVLLVYAKGEIGTMPPLFYVSDYEETLKYATNIETVISESNHYTMVFENRQEINEAIEMFLEKSYTKK
ncbi:alpha/beta fold hydrolase [Oceanobacillus salinisoli]|uniref:alpha/beta fold hydrolase n=1 Tax=Oceanobacillus salinisoli TaxID=2678611 RepID=UPI0012E0EEFA|nr:alpha/beta hydrolase [Oceanobacillus salinisoli]